MLGCGGCVQVSTAAQTRLGSDATPIGSQSSIEKSTTKIERVSAAVHAQWMLTKSLSGVHTRLSEDNEELMVPYDQLSEKAKELDRGSVRAVVAAILTSGYTITK